MTEFSDAHRDCVKRVAFQLLSDKAIEDCNAEGEALAAELNAAREDAQKARALFDANPDDVNLRADANSKAAASNMVAAAITACQAKLAGLGTSDGALDVVMSNWDLLGDEAKLAAFCKAEELAKLQRDMATAAEQKTANDAKLAELKG